MSEERDTLRQKGQEVNDLVRIEWNDAIADSCWTCVDEVIDHKIQHCVSVGWLIHETLEAYIITTTITDSGLCMGYIAIPKGMTVKMERLK